MTQLEYDSRDMRYHGEWADGRNRKFSVNADVVAEVISDESTESEEEALRSINWTEDMEGVFVEE